MGSSAGFGSSVDNAVAFHQELASPPTGHFQPVFAAVDEPYFNSISLPNRLAILNRRQAVEMPSQTENQVPNVAFFPSDQGPSCTVPHRSV